MLSLFEHKTSQLNLDQQAITQSKQLLDQYLSLSSSTQDYDQEVHITSLNKLKVTYLLCHLFGVLDSQCHRDGRLKLLRQRCEAYTVPQKIIRQLDSTMDTEQFLSMLCRFVKCVHDSIPSPVFNDIERAIAQATIDYRIYKKFDGCLSEIERSRSTPTFNGQQGNDYLQDLKNTAWLMFLLQKYEKRESWQLSHPVRNTYILIAHLTLVVLSLPQEWSISLDGVEDMRIEMVIQRVTGMVSQGFVINRQFNDEVLDYMKKCVQSINKIMKIQGKSQLLYVGILEEKQIKSHFRKFHKHYSNLIKEQDLTLDEESFLRVKVVFTPHKKSAIANHESLSPQYERINKRVRVNETKQESPTLKGFSESLLCFTPQQKAKTPQTPYNFMNTDNLKSKQRIPTTPILTILNEYQWLKTLQEKNKVRRDKFTDLMRLISLTFEDDLQKELTARVQGYFDVIGSSQDRNRADYSEDIVKFYMQVLEHIIMGPNVQQQMQVGEELLKREDFLYSLLAICILTFDYIWNKKEVDVVVLLDKCRVSSFEMWRVMSNFANFDSSIPGSVTKHLLEFEGKLFLFYIWQDRAQEVINILIKKTNGQTLRYFEDALISRLTKHAALRVIQLANVLKMNDEVRDEAWQIIQKVFNSPPDSPDLFNNRHLDMFIISAFYMILKNKKLEPKMDKFRELYNKAFPMDFRRVFIKIITFYNNLFLVHFKYLVSTPTPQSQLINSLFCSPMQSVTKGLLQNSMHINNNQYQIQGFISDGNGDYKNKLKTSIGNKL